MRQRCDRLRASIRPSGVHIHQHARPSPRAQVKANDEKPSCTVAFESVSAVHHLPDARHDDKQHVFTVVTASRTLRLSAPSADEAARWVDGLNRRIEGGGVSWRSAAGTAGAAASCRSSALSSEAPTVSSFDGGSGREGSPLDTELFAIHSRPAQDSPPPMETAHTEDRIDGFFAARRKRSEELQELQEMQGLQEQAEREAAAAASAAAASVAAASAAAAAAAAAAEAEEGGGGVSDVDSGNEDDVVEARSPPPQQQQQHTTTVTTITTTTITTTTMADGAPPYQHQHPLQHQHGPPYGDSGDDRGGAMPMVGAAAEEEHGHAEVAGFDDEGGGGGGFAVEAEQQHHWAGDEANDGQFEEGRMGEEAAEAAEEEEERRRWHGGEGCDGGEATQAGDGGEGDGEIWVASLPSPPPTLEAPPSALLDFEEPPQPPSSVLDFFAADLIAAALEPAFGAAEAEAEVAASRGDEPETDVYTAAAVQAYDST